MVEGPLIFLHVKSFGTMASSTEFLFGETKLVKPPKKLSSGYNDNLAGNSFCLQFFDYLRVLGPNLKNYDCYNYEFGLSCVTYLGASASVHRRVYFFLFLVTSGNFWLEIQNFCNSF